MEELLTIVRKLNCRVSVIEKMIQCEVVQQSILSSAKKI